MRSRFRLRVATGDPAQHQQHFIAAIGLATGPPDTSDPIAHWMNATAGSRPATTSRQTLQRHERSTLWFQLYRRGGRVILHHGHIRPVLVRDWSPKMDGITATIWASQTSLPLGPYDCLTSPNRERGPHALRASELPGMALSAR